MSYTLDHVSDKFGTSRTELDNRDALEFFLWGWFTDAEDIKALADTLATPGRTLGLTPKPGYLVVIKNTTEVTA